MSVIMAVRSTTGAVVNIKPEKNSCCILALTVHNCDNQLHLRSLIRGSNISLLYIHTHKANHRTKAFVTLHQAAFNKQIQNSIFLYI